MPFNDFDYEKLTKALTDNFNILADEVQLLSDHKTILEHKLRFAHEQYQHLADKYAPGDVQISSTLAKLQLPPDLHTSGPERAGFVPLPSRGKTQSKQQTAVAIRDGRRASQLIAQLAGRSVGSTSSGKSKSGSSLRYSARRTSLSTVLEQDFTVQGKKGSLLCPFSPPTNGMDPIMNLETSQGSDTQESDRPLTPPDTTPHQSADPICAAMYAETTSSAPPSVTGSGAKCPIRYLDQHSPEEVAAYFETHKHEIPRSHEVCVRRYQRNEDDIRKLDAKYGSLVNMIQGLGHKHQSMLPANEEDESLGLDRTSNERVENWAQAVSTDGVESDEEEAVPQQEEDDRESRFDRPLKEIRVGESPSRPWGISVPIFNPPDNQRPVSPPPAPVSVDHVPKTTGKCPFDHSKALEIEEKSGPSQNPERLAGECPFGHGQSLEAEEKPLPPPGLERPGGKCHCGHGAKAENEDPAPKNHPLPAVQTQPTYIQPDEVSKVGSGGPQMIFTGPVFIGYPLDQAIASMQQFKGT